MAKTVVLIDDDPDDLDVLRETIYTLNPSFHCISFRYPDEAIRVVCEELVVTPDYFFIDINMPVMPGDKCLSELRKRTEFNNSIIAILSTSVHREVSEALRSIGANYTFQKPLQVDAYKGIVETVFNTNIGTNKVIDKDISF